MTPNPPTKFKKILDTPNRLSSKTSHLSIVILLVVIAGVSIKIGDKIYTLIKEKALLEKHLDRYDKAEQYALLA